MGDMNDDAKELDNYGVWVKNAPQSIEGEPPAEKTPIEGLDLPDFGDFDNETSDAPENEDVFEGLDFTATAEDLQNDTFDEGDTTLSPDELANIAVSEMPEENFDDSDTTLNPDELAHIAASNSVEESFDEGDTALNPDELANIAMDIPQDEGINEAETAALSTAFFNNDDDLGTSEKDEMANAASDFDLLEAKTEEPVIEEQAVDMSGLPDITAMPDAPIFDEPAIDESAIDEPAIDETVFDAPAEESFDIPVEDTPAPTEEAGETEVSLDDFGDGEIDLDSFMSDSGGGGEEFTFDDGDIDLGDFMGEGFSSGSASKAPAEIQDEQTLDIKVDFDEDAKNIAVEDTPENEAAMFPKTAEMPATESTEMFSSFDEAVAAVGVPESSGGDTPAFEADDGEIDLSEFGFSDDDSNIGMTSGPEGVNSTRKAVVDYDMKVTVDDDSKTPPVLDVINGKISSKDNDEYDYEEDETTTTMEASSQNAVSPEISEKGKEILEQIMGELSSLKDEIKNIKSEFAELQSRSAAAPAAPISSDTPAADEPAAPAEEDNSGFFGEDDGDDTIALSGSEMTNILNSVELSEETQAEDTSDFPMDEPQVEENPEPEMEENIISEDELNIEDPTLESLSMGNKQEIAEQTILQESTLPDEITIPKSGNFNTSSTQDEPSEENSEEKTMDSMEDSLTEDKLNYLSEEPAIDETVFQEPVVEETAIEQEPIVEEEPEEKIPSVSDIMKENISMQEGAQEEVDAGIGIGIGDDIDAAFSEADAIESDIMDDSLAEKDNYDNSVSGIMSENISMQEENQEEVDAGIGIGIGDDIDAAFNEADAAESDIMDDSLAAKDAYEKEINKTVDDNSEETFSEPVIADSEIQEPVVEETAIEEPAFDEPVINDEPTISDDEISIDEAAMNETEIEDSTFDEPAVGETEIEETVVEAPLVEEPATPSFEETSVDVPVEPEPEAVVVQEPEPEPEPTIQVQAPAPAPAPAATSSQAASIPKDLKNEIVTVLCYMDQLLENLPEEKITEFARSEHFETYKKLFDDLGLS